MPDRQPTLEHARRVRAARVYSGIEQRELPARANVSYGRLRRIEQLKAVPTWEEMWSIAEACNVPRSFMEVGFNVAASDGDHIARQVAELQEWSERAVDRIIEERAGVAHQASERLANVEQKLDRLMHLVDQGLFTPRPADGGSREDQLPLGAALAKAFEADPNLLQSLRESLAQSTAPPQTGRARKKRRAA